MASSLCPPSYCLYCYGAILAAGSGSFLWKLELGKYPFLEPTRETTTAICE